MKIVADTHVHTVFSGHAHSTVMEYLNQAKKLNHDFLVLTDHTGALHSCTDPLAYFLTLPATLPQQVDGIRILKGCEVNIIDENANLDLPEHILERLDLVIASLHDYFLSPFGIEKTQSVWEKIAKNQNVDVIGHCAEPNWFFDYEAGVKVFKEYSKVVEINNASVSKSESHAKNWAEIVKLCKKYRVPVVLSSDTHFSLNLGKVKESIKLIEEIGFPEDLVLNASKERFAEYIDTKK